MTADRVLIRRVAQLGSGHTPSRSVPEYWEECQIPWLTLADVWQLRDGTIQVVTDTKEKISELGLANSAAEIHPRGTVALSRTASVGFSCILGHDMATSQDFATWTCGPRLRPRFLLWCLRGLRDEILAWTQGSTHQTIYMPDLEQLRVPLPELPVQDAVADFLDAETARIDALIAQKRRMAELLEEKRTAHLERAIRSLAEAEGTIALKHVVPAITVGIVVTPSKWYTDHGVSALRGVNVAAGKISLQDLVYLTVDGHELHAKSALNAGDVVVVRTGQAGAAAVVPDELAGANCIDLLLIRKSSQLDPKYLEYVINSDWARKHIEARSVGTIQSHFNVEALRELRVPAAGLQDQHALVRAMDVECGSLGRMATMLDRQVDLIAEHRQALITAAVTGELEIAGAAA